MEKELSFGQKAVGRSFNPSALPEVDLIKDIFASAIDAMHEMRERAKIDNNMEAVRYFSTAITHAEIAQMLGVKAATWKQ